MASGYQTADFLCLHPGDTYLVFVPSMSEPYLHRTDKQSHSPRHGCKAAFQDPPHLQIAKTAETSLAGQGGQVGQGGPCSWIDVSQSSSGALALLLAIARGARAPQEAKKLTTPTA